MINFRMTLKLKVLIGRSTCQPVWCLLFTVINHYKWLKICVVEKVFRCFKQFGYESDNKNGLGEFKNSVLGIMTFTRIHGRN